MNDSKITIYTNNLQKIRVLGPLLRYHIHDMEKETFLGHVSDDALKEIVAIQDRIKKLDNSAESKQDFIAHIKNVWDGFIEGEHHKLFAKS